MPVPTETTRTPQFEVRTNGAALPREAMDSLLECVVESSLHLPDLCTVRIYDYDFKWLDSNLFKEGEEIEIHAGWDQGSLATVFKGEIVGLELDLSAHHTATMIVRAYDKSHRLHRGRKCQTFVQVKDSDIVQKIAGETGLTADMKATSLVRPWILQNNQTDWEFLVELAKRNGYDLFLKKDKLHFEPAGNRTAYETLTLAWGKELRSFRPRTSAAQQMNEVEVRGWDPIKKQKIVGTAKTPQGAPKIGGESDGSKAAKKFGAKKTVVVDQPIHSVKEAETLAQSIRDQIGQDFLTADGLCDGTPELMAGTAVKIDNIGKRFSGTYHVTAATHVYSPAEGYTTQFAVSGTQPDNVLNLLGGGGGSGGGGGAGGATSDIGGNIMIAIVTDNLDPQQLGRVKVMYPWMAENLGSDWARVVSQMAGAGRGFFSLPEIGDEVLVAFEHGDSSRPYVLGQLWNGMDKPPVLSGGSGGGSMTSGPAKPNNDKEVDGGKVERRGYYTRIGHKLDFSDKDDKGYIWLQTKSGNEIALSDAEEGLWIKTKAGHWLMMTDKLQGIKVHSKGGHEIFMDDAGKKIVVKDSSGDVITMDAAAGKISMKANTEIDMQAPTINIKADLQLNAQALKTSVKGDTTLGLEGGVQATLKGGQVAVQGGAMVDIKGAMVMINS